MLALVQTTHPWATDVAPRRPGLGRFPPGARMPERVLADHELVWMLRGTARLTGEQPRDLKPGDLLLVPPGLRHGFVWDAREPTVHGYLHFDCATPLPASPLLVPMTRGDPLAALCAWMLRLAVLPEGEAPLRDTLAFVLRTLAGLPAPTPVATLPTPLAAALGWLREQWAEPPLRRVTTRQLAAAAALSVSQLTRLHVASFGFGPARGLSLVRLAEAESLLVRTDLPLEVVARTCGFADASHLSHRFREVHGTAPDRYRRSGTATSVLDDPGARALHAALR